MKKRKRDRLFKKERPEPTSGNSYQHVKMMLIEQVNRE